jgi:hypothetical protein
MLGLFFGFIYCVEKQDPALSQSCRKAADKVGELSLSTGRTAGVSKMHTWR